MKSQRVFEKIKIGASEYVVEAQDIDEKGKFVPVGKVPGGETKLVVRGLKNKGNYKFRYNQAYFQCGEKLVNYSFLKTWIYEDGLGLRNFLAVRWPKGWMIRAAMIIRDEVLCK